MFISQLPRHPRTPTPTPIRPQFEVNQVQQTRWPRIFIFPRNTYARLQHVPLCARRRGQDCDVALTHTVWACRTSFVKREVVRVKYGWEPSWDYYEIQFAIPIIPGFSRSNAALRRLGCCPDFVGEVAVVRRTGPRLSRVADMRMEDRRKVEVAVISTIRTAMGMDGRYRGTICVEYMMSDGALDNLQ